MKERKWYKCDRSTRYRHCRVIYRCRPVYIVYMHVYVLMDDN